MSKPVRVQLSRKRGWRMPENTLKVDRSTRWGNPHDWREWLENAPRDVLWTADERARWSRAQSVDAFREDIEDGTLRPDIEPLRGRNLACWCAPNEPCHADILLELSNRQ